MLFVASLIIFLFFCLLLPRTYILNVPSDSKIYFSLQIICHKYIEKKISISFIYDVQFYY